MSAPPQEKGAPITDRRQLIEYLEAGCKPKPDWRIGTEHEKFGYTQDDLRPLPYEGERGIGAVRRREGAPDRPAEGGRQRHPGARRPVRAVRAPGQDPARDLP